MNAKKSCIFSSYILVCLCPSAWWEQRKITSKKLVQTLFLPMGCLPSAENISFGLWAISQLVDNKLQKLINPVCIFFFSKGHNVPPCVFRDLTLCLCAMFIGMSVLCTVIPLSQLLFNYQVLLLRKLLCKCCHTFTSGKPLSDKGLWLLSGVHWRSWWQLSGSENTPLQLTQQKRNT